MRAIRVKLIEIVAQAGERNQAAHAQTGHIHEETEVAYVRNQSRVALRLGGAELCLQKRKHLHVLAIALGVRGITLRFRNMIGHLFE